MSDLIDRKEAVEAVKNEMLSWLEGDSHDYRKVVDAIMDVPTVDAVPVVHGKWMRDEFGSKCGACGLYAYRDKFDQPWESPYCPNCGADMRGEQDG